MKTRVLLLAVLCSACSAADKAETAQDSDPVVAALQDSIAKDSTNWQLRSHLASELRHKNRLEEAQAAAEKSFELAPSPATDARLEMAKVYAAVPDRSAAAINLVKEVEKKKRDGSEPADEVKIAEVYAVLGDTSAVFRWLTRAQEAKSPNLADIKSNREFAGYQSDPRWKGLFGS